MNRFLMAAAALAITVGASSAAAARPGFATANVHMRAGPSSGFPAVTTIPSGAEVNIHGCHAGYDWCDVGWSGTRGWVDAQYLQFIYRDRRVLLPSFAATVGLPIIAFSVGSYWDNYYRDRSWYHRRAYWHRYYGHHHDRQAVRRLGVNARPYLPSDPRVYTNRVDSSRHFRRDRNDHRAASPHRGHANPARRSSRPYLATTPEGARREAEHRSHSERSRPKPVHDY